ncbi:MAG: hypothetical protein JW893_01125 [Candidatus Omnitrophica bacterium]|nr:hypothetical protein [Candidatus Omnitrophota bacterium]
MKKTLLFLIGAVSLFSFISWAAKSASDELRVEGIVYEANSPQGSVAVINGQFLQEGNVFQGYRIESIQESWVTVSHVGTGQTEKLDIVGGEPSREVYKKEEKKEAVQPKQNAGVTAVPVRGQPATAGPMGEMMEQFQGVFGKVWEITAITEMKNIQASANVYAMEQNINSGIKISALINQGFLSGFSSDGVKGPYQYRIETKNGVAVGAAPVDKKSGLRSFYVDSEGRVHVSDKGLAAEGSPIYKPTGLSMLPVAPPGGPNFEDYEKYFQE